MIRTTSGSILKVREVYATWVIQLIELSGLEQHQLCSGMSRSSRDQFIR